MTAPERKRPQEGDAAALMREMGSIDGFDPIPPDQYLYFLGKPESPLQRLLALIRATTIRKGHRKPYCVDEGGKALSLGDLERRLQMDHGSFMRAWREIVARGLAKRKKILRLPFASAIFLCGNPKESVGYPVGEEKAAWQYSHGTKGESALSAAQRRAIGEWPKEHQQRFYEQFNPAVKRCREIEAEAIALARRLGEPIRHAVLRDFGLPPEPLPAFQPRLLAPLSPAGGSTATWPYTDATGGRTASPSLLTSENYQSQSVNSVEGSSSAARKDRPTDAAARSGNTPKAPQGEHGAHRKPTEALAPPPPRPDVPGAPVGELEAIAAMLREALAEVLPGHVPGPTLCPRILTALDGAPLVLLKMRLLGTPQRKFQPPKGSLGFAVELARDVGEAWRAGEAERERQQASRAAKASAASDAAMLDEESLATARAIAEDPATDGTVAGNMARRALQKHAIAMRAAAAKAIGASA